MTTVPAISNAAQETLLGQAADEFLEQIQRGEHPDIEEFASRYAEIATLIREVFPALQVMGPPAQDAPADPGLAAGTLGDYRIIRELGRGGMGIVYEAEQISLKRRVALKVLPFAAVLDERQLQRFRTEAQAAAQLHHTNIVPVFSVGCERGVHYYAMQYIEGHPLSRVIEELRLHCASRRNVPAGEKGSSGAGPGLLEPSTSPASSLLLPASPSSGASSLFDAFTAGTTKVRAYYRSVAAIAAQAAEALEHAHQHGIVHRDIKPSNLLLDARGQLWITDYGLALIQADAGVTITGDLVGTLRYMSPEQTLAHPTSVDHRTDVYSLGATLYELLTLECAFHGTNRHELLRRIAFEEPLPMRRLNPAIPRELETIVVKAMAKRPEERYATAEQVADDLRRFLEDKPILARRPTPIERAAKWSRRHRSLVAGTAVMLLLSVIGLSTGFVLILRERTEALRQRDAAATQTRLAEANFQIAREAVDRMLTRVAATELADLPHVDSLKRALLEDSLEFHRRLLIQKRSSESVRRDTARTWLQVAQLAAQLGRDEEAEQAYRKAIDLLKSVPSEGVDEPSDRTSIAEAYLYLGTLLWERRRASEAVEASEASLTLWRSLHAAAPDDAGCTANLSRALTLRGLVLRDVARLEEATRCLEEAISLREKLASAFPQEAAHRVEMARALRNMAYLQLHRNDHSKAVQSIRQAVELQQAMIRDYPGERAFEIELSKTRKWWQEVCRLSGRDPHLELASTPASSPAATVRPLATAARQLLVQSYNTLGHALQRSGEARASGAAYARAVAMQQALVARYPDEPRHLSELADLYHDHALSQRSEWELEEAVTASNDAIRILKRLVSAFPERPEYAARLREMESALASTQEFMPVGQLIVLSRKSPAGVAEAVKRARAMDENELPDRPFPLLIHAEHLLLGGDYQRGSALLRRAAVLRNPTPSCYKSLGWALFGSGRAGEAAQAFRDGLTAARIGPDAPLDQVCPDPSTAGFFLNRLSADEYAERWRGVVLFGKDISSLPWFYIGMRAELEGKLEQARTAYKRCKELSAEPRMHHSANWGAYRLTMLEAELAEREQNEPRNSLQ